MPKDWDIRLAGPTSWVGSVWYDKQLGAAVKFVLLALDLYAAEHHMAWPGQNELATLSGLGPDKVARALKAAKEAGYLRSVRRHNETVYFLTMPEQSRAMYGEPEEDETRIRVTLTPDQARAVREIIDPDGFIGECIAVFAPDGK